MLVLYRTTTEKQTCYHDLLWFLGDVLIVVHRGIFPFKDFKRCAREFQKKLFLNVSLCFLRFVTLFLLLNISFIILRIAKWCIPYTDIVYWKWYVSSNCCSKFYKPKYTRHFSFEISVYFQSPHVATFLFRLVNLLYDPYHIAHTKINVFLLYFLHLVAIFIPGKNPSYKSSSFFFLLCINIFFKDIFWCNNLNFHHYLSKSIYMNV